MRKSNLHTLETIKVIGTQPMFDERYRQRTTYIHHIWHVRLFNVGNQQCYSTKKLIERLHCSEKRNFLHQVKEENSVHPIRCWLNIHFHLHCTPDGRLLSHHCNCCLPMNISHCTLKLMFVCSRELVYMVVLLTVTSSYLFISCYSNVLVPSWAKSGPD